MSKTILIMAGGTGGHIFPALAIANELKKHNIALHWLGSNHGMENTIVPKHKIKLHCVSSVGLRGKSLANLIKAPFLLGYATLQVVKIFIKIKPDVVLGMGGFSAGIGGVIAWIFRVPLVIHEQNAIPGTTNKLLAKIASKVFQAFAHTFAKKIATTSGNPISFKVKQKTPQNQPLNLLVLGGSLGAKSINECIPKLKQPFNIWHQTGEKNFNKVLASYQGKDVKVSAFIEDMAAAYAWADVVVCRAGAMTISELIASKSVAVLVPFPYAIDDHQTVNGKILSDKGAAVLLPESALSAEKLDETLSNLDLSALSNALCQFEKNNAVQLISDYLKNCGSLS